MATNFLLLDQTQSWSEDQGVIRRYNHWNIGELYTSFQSHIEAAVEADGDKIYLTSMFQI